MVVQLLVFEEFWTGWNEIIFPTFLLWFQVLEWLDKHGVVFLNKNTAIGKSLEKAKAFQKNFKHFELVAQVGAISLNKII